jgi:Putative peptidoglycan binding domain
LRSNAFATQKGDPLRRLIILFATLPLLLGGGIATATAAQAAYPTCTSWTTYYETYSRDWVEHVPTTRYQSGNHSCQLKQGDKNDAVKVLQRALRWCWGSSLTVDGEYGPATKAQVVALQKNKNADFNAGLEVDGEFGPATSQWLQMPMWSWPDNQPAWTSTAHNDVICEWPNYNLKI